jgi:hypothetical protein
MIGSPCSSASDTASNYRPIRKWSSQGFLQFQRRATLAEWSRIRRHPFDNGDMRSMARGPANCVPNGPRRPQYRATSAAADVAGRSTSRTWHGISLPMPTAGCISVSRHWPTTPISLPFHAGADTPSTPPAGQATVWLAGAMQDELAGSEFVQWPIDGHRLLIPEFRNGLAFWVDSTARIVTGIGDLCNSRRHEP